MACRTLRGHVASWSSLHRSPPCHAGPLGSLAWRPVGQQAGKELLGPEEGRVSKWASGGGS
eukprot:2192002-Pyramimonas_sp.AAC.1